MLTTSDVIGKERPPAQPAAEVKVRVLRSFCLAGEPQKVGSKLSINKRLAVELIHAGKAELAPDAPAKAAPQKE